MATKVTPQQILELVTSYRDRPHEFIKTVLGCNTWYMQDEITKSVFENKITAVKTCNAIGKSYIAARIAITYLFLYPGSIVVTTAPTWRQVTDVLWREIATAYKRSKYKLSNKEVTQAGLNLNTDWYAVGLSTKRPENFFGYHADNILVIVDEAGAVEEPIFKGVAAITPNINSRILYIGNPTEPSGTFYDCFNKPELGAKCFTVSAFDTPNFTANNIKTIEDLLALMTPPEGVTQTDHNRSIEKKIHMPFPNLVDPLTVYRRYHEWGTDSPSWEALIMGEFPSQSNLALIPANLVTMAMNMYGIDKDSGIGYAELSGWEIPDGPPSHGQDMARFGSDLNVNFPRRGGWVDEPIIWNKKGEGKADLMESADKILSLINPLDENTTVNIDDTGNGGGTTDRLRQIARESMASGKPAHRYKLNAYNFSSKEFMNEDDRAQFHDITSMLYWNLRKQFYDKKIALHFNQDLFDQLVGRRWSIVPGGKIKVESKDEYKKRTGGKSPDLSDSLALSFAPNTFGSWAGVDVTANRSDTTHRQSVTPLQPKYESYQRDLATPITADIDQRY